MNDKEIEKIVIYTFLNHKDKWVSINGLARVSGLPYEKIEAFIKHTGLLQRAKKKNRRGNILYALNDTAKELYKLEKIDTEPVFAKTKELLLDGKLQEAINDFYAVLKEEQTILPKVLVSIYKDKLIHISNQYFQLDSLWKSDQISTQERFEETDKFIYQLYESIVEIEFLLKELHKYKFKYKNVTIKIDKDYQQFNQSDSAQVLHDISSLLNVGTEEIRVQSIQEGSVIMTLEFDNSEQAETLFLLIKLGKLKKEGISDARLKMLSEKVEKQQSTVSNTTDICQQAKQQIQKGQAEEAIQILLKNKDVIKSKHHNALFLLSSDMENLIKRSNLGIEKPEDIRITRNRITYSLLELIDKIAALSSNYN